MGTRSVVEIKDEQGKSLVKVYRQYDGYPTGRGQDIQDAFGDAIFCNGIGGDDANKENIHNGMSCFAATYIKKEKEGIGGVYLYTGDVTGEEYGYILEPSGLTKAEMFGQKVKGLKVTIYHGDKVIYKGSLKKANMKAIEKKGNKED